MQSTQIYFLYAAENAQVAKSIRNDVQSSYLRWAENPDAEPPPEHEPPQDGLFTAEELEASKQRIAEQIESSERRCDKKGEKEKGKRKGRMGDACGSRRRRRT